MNINQVVEPLRGVMSSIYADANAHKRVFNDCHSVQHKEGASLFQPINGDPFVAVIVDSSHTTRHTFKPDNRESGTDKLRARILATNFYEGLSA